MRKYRWVVVVVVALVTVLLLLFSTARYSRLSRQLDSLPTVPHPDSDTDGIPDAVDLTPGGSLFWNTWLSDGDQLNTVPLTSLSEDSDYTLTIDLSGVDYRRFDPAVQAADPAPAVKDKLTLDAGASRFEVLLLADSAYFEHVGQNPWEGDMSARIRPIPDAVDSGTPFGDKNGTKPAYLFGRLQLQLRTKTVSNYPIHTQLGLSIWDRDRPVDALELPVCIQKRADAALKDLCGLAQATGTPAHAAWPDEEPADASLQLVGQGQERIWSVFRKKGETLKSAVKWTVSRTGEGALRGNIENILKMMEKAKDDRLPTLGSTMLNVLFPDKTSADARQAVESSLRSMMASAHSRPTLLLKTPSSTLIPLGLAAIYTDKDAAFLGDRFAIELPLGGAPHPARRGGSCDLSWISVLPKDTDVKNGADQAMADVRVRLKQQTSIPLLNRWDDPDLPGCAFSELDKFGDWMNVGASPLTRAGLMLISHHASGPGTNLLYFAMGQTDGVAPAMLRRRFGDGSLAILNACGTGGASALGFVDTLNGLGFHSIVATATEVYPRLAVDFTYCLAKQITETPKAIGEAFDAALQCLSHLENGLYGPRAFTYTLLGDRATTICAQTKDAPCASYQ